MSAPVWPDTVLPEIETTGSTGLTHQNAAGKKHSVESIACRVSLILTLPHAKVDYPHLWYSRDRLGRPCGSILTTNYFRLEILP